MEDKTPFTKYKRHLCFTHDTREQINQIILRDRKYDFEFDKDKNLNASVGVILSCRLTIKKLKIYKLVRQ